MQTIRVAELSAIFSGWDHELQTSKKKRAFYLFLYFFIPSVVLFFFGTLEPVG